jgi:hypothetical protein
VLVAEQLPASNPVRKSALEYIHAYEGAYGKGSVSTFGGHVWDAGKVLAAAVPAALKARAAGHRGLPLALRDALEQVKDVAARTAFNMSAQDHLGLDQRGVVMVKIENGKWVYQPSNRPPATVRACRRIQEQGDAGGGRPVRANGPGACGDTGWHSWFSAINHEFC